MAPGITSRDELIRTCEGKVEDYLQRRGARAYDHRRTALGELSGTARYQVLSRAGFRCELCGVRADEEALEVDPSFLDVTEVKTMRQALCWKCNTNKGAREYESARVGVDFLALRPRGVASAVWFVLMRCGLLGRAPPK